MPDTPSRRPSFPPSPRRSRRMSDDPDGGGRAGLAQVIPRRPGVSWWLGLVLALGFAGLVTPAITAEHWMLRFGPGAIAEHREAPFTVRAPMTGTGELRVGGGVVVARGERATRDEAALADAIAGATPGGPGLYLAFFALTCVLGALFTHHVGRSTKGRLVRVQVVSLATIAVLAVAVKIVLLSTALSALVVPIAVLAMVPTMVLDRVVGLATGVLAALVVSLQAPFDIGLALLLLVQTAAAGLVVAERPRRRRWLAALTTGAVTTLCTAATYLLLTYLTTGHAPELRDPLHSPWLAAAIGPAVAALLAVPLIPIYQLLVGEITQGRLIALEDLGHPLLRQIAEKSPGTWQHSLMMANMAEIAANAIGANGRLVRVGAYFHDLGKSLQPKYFIENLEAGETSPHDLLPPEVSCDAIFAHVTEGIVTARKAGLHERIVDFMHMHHGNGVLEYFWAKCREQGNPSGLTIEDFRYPGHPPQSRETALLAICDAVEAASRTLHKPDAAAIDSLVQRIVYGKLHLGQLDESGLSMGDLRRISDSLRETIRHANHGRIEYPWQKAGQDASASAMATSTTAPRLDSLDRKPARDTARRAPRPGDSDTALAATADVKDSAPTRADTGDAAKIRAGTARNAQPSERRLAPEPVVDPTGGSAPRPAAPEDPRDATRPLSIDDPGAAHTQLPRADAIAIEPTTLPGRAPGPVPTASAGEASSASAVEASPAVAAPRGRDLLTTLPGRAPGPTPAPPEEQAASAWTAAAAARLVKRAPSHAGDASPARAVDERSEAMGGGDPAGFAGGAAGRTPRGIDERSEATGGGDPAGFAGGAAGRAPRGINERSEATGGGDPAGFAGEAAGRAPRGINRSPIVGPPPPGRDPMTTLPGRAPGPTPATTSGAVPPVPGPEVAAPAALPAPDAPLADPARSAGPPGPVDLDSAITNPPPLRRGAAGQPAAPADPAQLAAALVNLVQRVAHAPFGKPAEGAAPDAEPPIAQPAVAPSTADRHAAVTVQVLPAAAALRPSPGPSLDAAVTQPAAPRLHPSDLDAAGTHPALAAASASAERAARDLDAAITQPVRPAAPAPAARPGADGATAHPPPAGVRARTGPPLRTSGLAAAGSGPLPAARVADDDATTLRRPPADPVAAAALGTLNEDARVTLPRTPLAPPASTARALAHIQDPDAGVTEPSIPVLAVGDQRRIDVPLRPDPAPAPAPEARSDQAGWAAGLAARVDAALDSDSWGKETPIVGPTSAELRVLLGQADPTRQQPIEEIERLQRRAAELSAGEPPRRSPHPTTEVDPDDIEAAIEVAPPARRGTHPNATSAKPRKPE
jgi:cyclic-di-AMP phosphodiesterase PgpH